VNELHHHNNNSDDSDESDLPTDLLHQSQTWPTGTPPVWQDVPLDTILAKVKTLKPDFLESKGLRQLHKSYNSWDKMTADQQDKAATWF